MDGGLETPGNKLTLNCVADCPSLLCEELEDGETKSSQRCNKRLRKEGEVQLQILQHRDDEAAAQEVAQEKEQEVRGIKVLAAETEEKQVALDASRGETQEEGKDRQSSDKRDERKRNRKRKGRKQSERGRHRKCLKRCTEQQEENNRSQTQEMSAVSSEDSSPLSEPPAGLMSSCDLSEPVFMGCGVTGLCCPPVPMLCSSQAPVSVLPAPPQPHGTKRPPSPLLPHGLPLPGPQPLEVGASVCSHTVRQTYIKQKTVHAFK